LNITFRYGERASKPTVIHLSVGTGVNPAIQAIIDYNFSGHWFTNTDVKQIFLNTTAQVHALGTTVKAHIALTRWWLACVLATASERRTARAYEAPGFFLIT
jgi:outer membrane protein W